MDGIVDLPMSMKQIPSPATSIKKRYNKITFTSKTVKQKIGLKMKNFKSLDNEPSSQRKLDIDTGNMFSQRQLAYYNDFKQKINSPLFKR